MVNKKSKVVSSGTRRLSFWLLAVGLLSYYFTANATQRALSTYIEPLTKLTGNPPTSVLQLALQAYEKARTVGLVKKPILAIIDYSRPSTERRLWIIDVEEKKLLFNSLVAHGVNSGDTWATRFSNLPESRTSSIGVFITAETYYGKHGYSLRVDGVEEGINDKARQRAIVFHGASYASEKFVQQHGRLGRSWGCPAVDPSIAREVIDTLKEGALVFSYFPDETWLKKSRFIQAA